MKERGLNFNRHVKKLFMLRMDNDIAGIVTLKNLLMETYNLTYKTWLLEKTEELLKIY